jgi:hypothetical protein
VLSKFKLALGMKVDNWPPPNLNLEQAEERAAARRASMAADAAADAEKLSQAESHTAVADGETETEAE